MAQRNIKRMDITTFYQEFLRIHRPHALPHGAPLEVTVALSCNGPLPNPVSPIYPDYRRHYLGLLPSEGVEVFGYGGEAVSGLTLLPTIREVLDQALQWVSGVSL